MVKRNKEFIIAGISNLLKRNYGIDPNKIDLESHVDSELDFGENWTIIKEMFLTNHIDFEYLKCEHCNFNIKDTWLYCPKCGKTL